MTASGYARRSDGTDGGATVHLSSSVRYALAAVLIVVGIADLAAIDGVLLPRYLVARARVGSSRPAPVVVMPVAVARAAAMATPTAAEPVAVAPVATPVPRAQLPPDVAPAVAPPASPEPIQPPPTEVAPTPSANLAEVEFPPLLFARNTSWLSPAAREILAQLATTLAENPSRRVVISGHSDNVGPEELNRALSVERARRCGKWLEGHGVDPARMDIQGFGSTRPAGGDNSPEAQVHNRRVEIDLR